MKKFCIIFIVVLISSSLFAQEENIVTKRNNEFRISFFQFIMSTFRLSYERMFNNNSSLVLNGEVRLKQEEYNDILGGGGELQLRFYAVPKQESEFDGFYTGPYILYRYTEITNYYDYYPYETKKVSSRDFFSNFGGGIIIGIKISAAERVTFDFNFGGGVKYTENSSSDPSTRYDDNIFEPGFTGITPKANFSFGLKF